MSSTLALEAVLDQAALRSSIVLSSDDLAPRRARHFARIRLSEWALDELTDPALLIVSELVTNARHHGRIQPDEIDEEITLVLSHEDRVLGIEVADSSCHLPVPRVGRPGAVNGRGLHLVAAVADAWTTRLKEDGTGKRVLAFLCCPKVTARS